MNATQEQLTIFKNDDGVIYVSISTIIALFLIFLIMTIRCVFKSSTKIYEIYSEKKRRKKEEYKPGV